MTRTLAACTECTLRCTHVGRLIVGLRGEQRERSSGSSVLECATCDKLHYSRGTFLARCVCVLDSPHITAILSTQSRYILVGTWRLWGKFNLQVPAYTFFSCVCVCAWFYVSVSSRTLGMKVLLLAERVARLPKTLAWPYDIEIGPRLANMQTIHTALCLNMHVLNWLWTVFWVPKWVLYIFLHIFWFDRIDCLEDFFWFARIRYM